MNQIHIVSVADDNYAQHLGVMMTSLLENSKNSNDITFHILHDGLSEINKKKLTEVVSKYHSYINFYLIDKEGFMDFGLRDMSHVAYYKVIIPSVLDYSISKAIFLDCDVIVKDDINKLWKMNIDNYHLAAVKDIGFDRHDELGIPENEIYFNSGVMLLNLEKWRNENITDAVLNFIILNSKKTTLHDQDALNAILYNTWYPLHPKWNQQTKFFNKQITTHAFNQSERLFAMTNPSIIHYTGPSKPWHYFNERPFKEEYFNYLKLSPWKEYTFFEEDLFTNKRLILFGAGSLGLTTLNKCLKKSLQIDYFVDNDSEKWGKELERVKIYSPNRLNKESKDEIVVLISSSFYDEITNQLETMGFRENKNYIMVRESRLPKPVNTKLL